MSAHGWPATAAVTGYVACYVVVSIAGMHYGYPQVLWVWAVLLFVDFEIGECDCCERGDY
ncbi:hypothetical protein [Natrialba aegyptia]|uniref:hypothetical protein n=1 Tax=Natrialba aegyptia TaxID=129789 RepID=UPI0006780617|nr:hypothetical protein [Natrialba aegyptia]